MVPLFQSAIPQLITQQKGLDQRMQLHPSQANRFAYAKVRLPDGISSTHAKRCFENVGWTFDSDHRERLYTLHIPLYCASLTAANVAKSTLEDFAATQVPLLVEGIAVLTSSVRPPTYVKVTLREENSSAYQSLWKTRSLSDDVTPTLGNASLNSLIEEHRWKVVCLVLVLALGGLYLGYTIFPGDLNQLAKATLIVVSSVIALFGWRHLAILYPKIQLLWSGVSLSLLVAASAVLGQLLIGAWESHFRLPSNVVDYPVWFPLVAAGYATLTIALAVFLTFGLVLGWSAYLGLPKLLPDGWRTLLVVVAALITFLAMLNAFQLILARSAVTLANWHHEFNENLTPKLPGDFLYRACLVPESETSSEEEGLTEPEPLTIIQGREDQYWSWDIPSEASVVTDSFSEVSFYDRTVTRLNTQGMTVIRLADGITSCDAAMKQ